VLLDSDAVFAGIATAGFLSVMARHTVLALAAAALLLLSSCAAQNNETATRVGTAAATSQSQQIIVPGNGGCVSFTYAPDRTPGFNYTAYLGLPTTLPTGCTNESLTISKMYTMGSCPDTRANNYAVASLNIVNSCTDEITVANNDTCNAVIDKAPDGALAPKGIGMTDLVDSGQTCWDAPTIYFFVRNSCENDVRTTIKVTFDTYYGTCTNAADSDDGGDDVGGEAPSSGGGLSKGAKAGIAIGVIVGVALIVAAAWFLCCQLRKS
jgi:hypothetical protein